MNKNLQIKTKRRLSSLNFEESKQISNGNGGDTTTALMVNGNMPQSEISQSEISGKTNNSIKGNGLVKGCVQTNNTAPQVVKSEINRLAEAWCELLLRQIQEEKTQLSLERANLENTGENINRAISLID